MDFELPFWIRWMELPFSKKITQLPPPSHSVTVQFSMELPPAALSFSTHIYLITETCFINLCIHITIQVMYTVVSHQNIVMTSWFAAEKRPKTNLGIFWPFSQDAILQNGNCSYSLLCPGCECVPRFISRLNTLA